MASAPEAERRQTKTKVGKRPSLSSSPTTSPIETTTIVTSTTTTTNNYLKPHFFIYTSIAFLLSMLLMSTVIVCSSLFMLFDGASPLSAYLHSVITQQVATHGSYLLTMFFSITLANSLFMTLVLTSLIYQSFVYGVSTRGGFVAALGLVFMGSLTATSSGYIGLDLSSFPNDKYGMMNNYVNAYVNVVYNYLKERELNNKNDKLHEILLNIGETLHCCGVYHYSDFSSNATIDLLSYDDNTQFSPFRISSEYLRSCSEEVSKHNNTGSCVVPSFCCKSRKTTACNARVANGTITHKRTFWREPCSMAIARIHVRQCVTSFFCSVIIVLLAIAYAVVLLRWQHRYITNVKKL